MLDIPGARDRYVPNPSWSMAGPKAFRLEWREISSGQDSTMFPKRTFEVVEQPRKKCAFLGFGWCARKHY